MEVDDKELRTPRLIGFDKVEDDEEEEEEDKGRGKKMKTVQRRKSFSSSSISKRSKYEKKFHSKTLHTFLSY